VGPPGAEAEVVAGVAVAAVVVAVEVAVDAEELRMKRACKPDKVTKAMNGFNVIDATRRIALLFLLVLPMAVAAAEQTTFASPEQAVDALIAALKADDDAAMLAIFGDKHKSLVVMSDRAENSASRAELLARMQSFRNLQATGADRRTLYIGGQAWPMPIPIVRSGTQWRFATELGEEEIFNRRIGANENSAIAVLHAYLDAQRQYASRDRDGDDVLQYARKIGSTPGKHDGLYWEAADDGEESPFGPLIAESSAYLKGHKTGDAYRGYHFRVLDRQGKNAPGGAYSYVINGRMIAGFAMVAYPAVYGESGVMTFIVSNNGKIFEKDLGKNSEKVGAAMTTFDPGPGWMVAGRAAN
jgi:hypothetical protein